MAYLDLFLTQFKFLINKFYISSYNQLSCYKNHKKKKKNQIHFFKLRPTQIKALSSGE